MIRKVTIFMLLAALFVPNFADAATHSNIQAQLNSLERILENLEDQVRKLVRDDRDDRRRSEDPEVYWSDNNVTARAWNDRRYNVELFVDLGYPQPDRYRLQFECPRDIELNLRIYGDVCGETLTFRDPRHSSYTFDGAVYTRVREWDRGEIEVRLTTYEDNDVDETDRADLNVRSGDLYPDRDEDDYYYPPYYNGGYDYNYYWRPDLPRYNR